MIILRYFAKEVISTLSALTSILLLVFLSNQFVHYLMRAAEGQFPGWLVMQLMMLEIPNLLGLLLPLGLFMAILLSYGRLYADNEMTVLEACGFSPARLLAITLFLAGSVAAVIAVLMLWVSPKITLARDHILTGGGPTAAMEALVPGKFHSLSHGTKVLYVEKKSQKKRAANHLFLAQQAEGNNTSVGAWDIVTAKQVELQQDDKGRDFVMLHDGHAYAGVPGQKDFRVFKFASAQMRLTAAKPRVRKEERALPTSALLPFNNKDPRKAAELQWRISIPLMALTLAFLAVPMSYVRPRQGKFAKLLPSILIFILYANAMFVARDWLRQGTLPPWLGMWWLHGMIILLTVGLLVRRRRS